MFNKISTAIQNLKIISLPAILLFLCSCSPETDETSKINKKSRGFDLNAESLNENIKDAPVSLQISQRKKDLEKAVKIRQYCNRLSRGIFNGCVLVAKDSRIIFDTALGNAHFNPKVPLNLHTSFHLASVSKQFTAMGITLLKQDGKLDFDDEVGKHINDFPYKNVTIRHLLTHTSGLPNMMNYRENFLSFWDSCKVAENKDVPYMLKSKAANYRIVPGRRFSYNNLNYVLLALIIENVSGKSFDAFTQERIFDKLKMKDSKVYDFNKHSLNGKACGYNTNGRWYSKDEDDIRNGLVGDKGIYSSVIDLYKWDQALYSNVLVDQKLLKETFENGSLENGRKIQYAFGWRKSKTEPQIVYHFGHWRGFNTCIIRFTEDKNTIIILNNTNYRHLKSVADNLIKVLYEEEQGVPKL